MMNFKLLLVTLIFSPIIFAQENIGICENYLASFLTANEKQLSYQYNRGTIDISRFKDDFWIPSLSLVSDIGHVKNKNGLDNSVSSYTDRSAINTQAELSQNIFDINYYRELNSLESKHALDEARAFADINSGFSDLLLSYNDYMLTSIQLEMYTRIDQHITALRDWHLKNNIKDLSLTSLKRKSDFRVLTLKKDLANQRAAIMKLTDIVPKIGDCKVNMVSDANITPDSVIRSRDFLMKFRALGNAYYNNQIKTQKYTETLLPSVVAFANGGMRQSNRKEQIDQVNYDLFDNELRVGLRFTWDFSRAKTISQNRELNEVDRDAFLTDINAQLDQQDDLRPEFSTTMSFLNAEYAQYQQDFISDFMDINELKKSADIAVYTYQLDSIIDTYMTFLNLFKLNVENYINLSRFDSINLPVNSIFSRHLELHRSLIDDI